jgi:hypothetical protein
MFFFVLFYFKNIKIHFKNYQKINLFQVSSFILLIIYVSVPVVFYFILFFKIVIKHCLESRRHGGIFFIYIEPAPGQNECIGRFGVASNYRAWRVFLTFFSDYNKALSYSGLIFFLISKFLTGLSMVQINPDPIWLIGHHRILIDHVIWYIVSSNKRYGTLLVMKTRTTRRRKGCPPTH